MYLLRTRRSLGRLLTALLLPLCFGAPSWAAGEQPALKPRMGRATNWATTPPLRLMPAPTPQAYSGPPREVNPLGVPEDFLRGRPPVAPRMDPLIQGFPSTVQAPAVGLTFNGIDGTANIPILGGQVAPPDTTGDIGPNHYVQWVNSAFQIWSITRDVDGHPTGFTSVQGPTAGNIFWQTLPAGSPCRVDNSGDPIVSYDHLAGRWLFSQFTSPNRPDGFQCVAVSQTSDPLGPYNAYEFEVSPGQFNDYPKLGVWQDGYYMTTNEFAASFAGVHVTVFERDVILAGGPAPQFVQFNLPFTGAAPVAFSLLPGHFAGFNPVPANTCNWIVQSFDEEVWGDATAAPDGYRTWRACVDWDTPASSTLTELPFITAAPFDAQFCNFSGNCIPQPGTANGLDVLGQFTKYRATIKYFPSTNQIRMVTTHDVDANGSNRAGVRWVELEMDNTPSILDSGTFEPGDGQNRWMSSAAYDAAGNIGVTFTRSGGGAGQFPSVYYSGRETGDAAGTLQAESVCINGAGAQTGTNRWGDYSTIAIDPVDQCTFWMTNEYIPANTTFTWFTRICTFRFPSCIVGDAGTISGTVTDDDTGDPIQGATVTTGTFQGTTDADGEYSFLAAPGTYDVTASHPLYNPETVNGVVVVDGGTTDVDFALEPLDVVNVSGTVTDGSGAGWPLYARITITGPGAPAGPIFTDPADGTYGPVPLLGNTDYTFTIEAEVDGYLTETATVNNPPTTATEDFELVVDSTTCTAPGYTDTSTTFLSENFSGGIPGTWIVVDNSTLCTAGVETWSTNDLRPVFPADSPIVTPLFAIINSDECGSTAGSNINTDLITPPLDLSGLGGSESVTLNFNSDYRDLCTVAATDSVTLEIGTFDTGTQTWTSLGTLQNYCGVTNRRNTAESFSTQLGNGLNNVRFRFHYDSNWDWWWAVDDVEVAQTSCTFKGEGLIWGFITQSSNGNPVNDATVSVDDPAVTTASFATPDDPNVDDGIYFIGGAPGTRTVTASKPAVGSASDTVAVTSGDLARLDLALTAADLDFNPNPLFGRAALESSSVVNASVSNSGVGAGSFTLIEVNTEAPQPRGVVAGRIDEAPLRVPHEKPFIFALGTREFPERPFRPSFPTPILAGEISGSFATGFEGGPYGNGVRQVGNGPVEVWLGNLAAIAGPDENREFTSDGETFLTATGTEVAPVEAAVFYADMTYNPRTQSYWQVNVGGDNCIHEFTDTGFTGDTICPAFATSMRGLAYNPVGDTYFAGSFNDGAIVEFGSDGTILRTIAKDVDTVGLAYNPITGHLFAMQNTASPEVDIVVMDANDPDFAFLNAFDLSENGVGRMGDFEQAGLDIDCEGRLWADNFVTGDVYVADSGEGSACTDIPWLTLSPTSGTVAAGGSTPVAATFDADDVGPGCYEAHVLMESDTAEGTEVVPVFFTAAFQDVPASSPFDRFIHGLAGAGVTNGCGSGNFCPSSTVTRAQMAVWLLRGKFGADYTPPPATGLIFDDVPPESFAADYIERLFQLQVTGGCDTSNYCPNNGVTRAQMAVFLLRTLEGPSYTPPPATGVFGDVPASDPFAPWIEELFDRGITAGCSTTPPLYCPTQAVPREQMAVFVTETFDLPLCPVP